MNLLFQRSSNAERLRPDLDLNISILTHGDQRNPLYSETHLNGSLLDKY